MRASRLVVSRGFSTRSLATVAERTVFITGGAFTPRVQEFLEQVPNLRLDKPLDPSALRALVSERVKQRQPLAHSQAK
jgi:hypothetical protein